MNKAQREILDRHFITLYDTTEKVDDLSEAINDPRLSSAVEKIVEGLDLMAKMFSEIDEAKKKE